MKKKPKVKLSGLRFFHDSGDAGFVASRSVFVQNAFQHSAIDNAVSIFQSFFGCFDISSGSDDFFDGSFNGRTVSDVTTTIPFGDFNAFHCRLNSRQGTKTSYTLKNRNTTCTRKHSPKFITPTIPSYKSDFVTGWMGFYIPSFGVGVGWVLGNPTSITVGRLNSLPFSWGEVV